MRTFPGWMLRAATVVASLVVVGGCAPKATFDLSITNSTSGTVTVGVVKEGPPYERDLAGPEEWALESRIEALRPWGHVVPPGRTMDSGALTGAFPQGSAAYL